MYRISRWHSVVIEVASRTYILLANGTCAKQLWKLVWCGIFCFLMFMVFTYLYAVYRYWTYWENANVWLGHVLKHESLLHDITEGRMRGKAKGGRKRMHLLNQLMNEKYVALKRTAKDRKEWQKLLRAESNSPASQQITWRRRRRVTGTVESSWRESSISTVVSQ